LKTRRLGRFLKKNLVCTKQQAERLSESDVDSVSAGRPDGNREKGIKFVDQIVVEHPAAGLAVSRGVYMACALLCRPHARMTRQTPITNYRVRNAQRCLACRLAGTTVMDITCQCSSHVCASHIPRSGVSSLRARRAAACLPFSDRVLRGVSSPNEWRWSSVGVTVDGSMHGFGPDRRESQVA
jgi:hypothetical protein